MITFIDLLFLALTISADGDQRHALTGRPNLKPQGLVGPRTGNRSLTFNSRLAISKTFHPPDDLILVVLQVGIFGDLPNVHPQQGLPWRRSLRPLSGLQFTLCVGLLRGHCLRR